MIKINLIFILLLYSINSAFSQSEIKHVKIEFRATFKGKKIELNTNSNPDSGIGKIEFSAIKFYVGKFAFGRNQPMAEQNKYHLLDVASPESMFLNFNFEGPIEYESINFNLGVDSLTNNRGALEGDLDPTKGMYWAWQSGYINIKIEGTCDSIQTKSNQFQYHLGGFLAPYESLQTVQLNTESNNSIIIEFDIESLLRNAFKKKYFSTMLPGIISKEMSLYAAEAFKIVNEK